MKIQLDTVKKTIKIDEAVNLGEFIGSLKKLFPNNEWKEYTIESVTILTNWVNPITINPVYPIYPQWPYHQVICGTGTGETTFTNTITGSASGNSGNIVNSGNSTTVDYTKGIHTPTMDGVYCIELSNQTN